MDPREEGKPHYFGDECPGGHRAANVAGVNWDDQLTADEANALEPAMAKVYEELKSFETEPYGDLRLNAHRAAVIAMSAVQEAGWRQARPGDVNLNDIEATMPKEALEKLGWMRAEEICEAIAFRIRAELVCCDIYERLAPQREAETLRTADYRGHDICYWGEAAARLSEAHHQEGSDD